MLERAKIEEQYAKSLNNLSKCSGFEVDGTLSRFWSDVKESTAQVANHHLEYAKSSREIAANLEKEVKTLKAEKKKLNKEYEKVNAELEKRLHKHNDSCTVYHMEVTKAENAKVKFDNGQLAGIIPKEMEKLLKQFQKQIKTLESANKSYEKSVYALREIQEEHEQVTTVNLERFHQIETERMKYLLQQFSTFTQHQEDLTTALTSVTGNVRASIGNVDTEADLDAFIVQHEAKEGRPARVEYEPKECNTIADDTAAVIRTGDRIERAPAAGRGAAPQQRVHAEEDQGVVISAGAALPAAPKGIYCVGLYNFPGESEEDLPFNAGDKLRLVVHDPEQQWWTAELNGRQGTIPANFVQLVDGAAQDPAPAAGVQPMNGTCEAVFDFVGETNEELSFSKGEQLQITGMINGWYMGIAQNGKQGLFPANYVNLL